MPVYVSMLRGINVGGHKLIKMEKLRAAFVALGFEDVQTYIQSGNVVFKATKTTPAALSKKIEEKILKDFGFSVPVISRTQEELGKAIQSNPFLKKPGIDLEKLHVTFLAEPPAAPGLKKLAEYTIAPDGSCCVGSHVYLHLPNGFSKSSLFKVPWEKALAVVTTTRNWKTVNTLYQMCQECE